MKVHARAKAVRAALPGRVSRWRRSWVLAFRLAWRDISRHRGRSVWVAVAVMTPVLAVCALLWASSFRVVSDTAAVPALMGSSQARLEVNWTKNFVQQPSGELTGARSFGDVDEGTDAPALSKAMLTQSLEQVGGGQLLAGRWLPVTALPDPAAHGQLNLLLLDINQRATAGMVTLKSGRAPANDNEVVVNADSVGLRQLPSLGPLRVNYEQQIGASDEQDSYRQIAHDYTVVGTVSVAPGTSSSNWRTPDVIGLPTQAFPLASTLDGQSAQNVFFLLERDQPLTWEQVPTLNALGLVVFSRHVLADPPPHNAVALPGGQAHSVLVDVTNDQAQAWGLAGLALIFGMILFLCAPVFAVIARRQQRALALAAVQGATRAQALRTVLAHALLLGVASSLVGAAAGVGIGQAYRALTHSSTETVQQVSLWAPLLGVVVIVLGACLATVSAAAVPARAASRAEVVSALQGHVRTRAGKRVVASLLGVISLAVGLVMVLSVPALLSSAPYGAERALALALTVVGVLLVMVGLLALVPLQLSLLDRFSARLPLPLRMGWREAARQRERSVPAIAAVMASTVAITTVLIAGATLTSLVQRVPTPVPATWAVANVTPMDAAVQQRAIEQALPSARVSAVQQLARTGTGPESRPYPEFYTAATVPCTWPQAGMKQLCQRSADRAQGSSAVAAEEVVIAPAPILADGLSLDAQQREGLEKGGVMLAIYQPTPQQMQPWLDQLSYLDPAGLPDGVNAPVPQQLLSLGQSADTLVPLSLQVFAKGTVDPGRPGAAPNSASDAEDEQVSTVQRADVQAQVVRLASWKQLQTLDMFQNSYSMSFGKDVSPPTAVIMTPETAHAMGLKTEVSKLVVVNPEPLASHTVAQLSTARDQGVSFDYLPSFFTKGLEPLLWGLLLVGIVLVITAAVTVTALSAHETRADNATMQANGASPGLTRAVAAVRAWTSSTLGVGTGLLVGGLLSFAVVPFLALSALAGLGSSPWEKQQLNLYITQGMGADGLPKVSIQVLPELALPWGWLVLLLVVAPLLAAAFAAVITTTRMRVDRVVD